MLTQEKLDRLRAANMQAADARARAEEAAERALSEGGMSDVIRSEMAAHHAMAGKMQHEADLIVQAMMTSLG
ncbi:MAG: hypothetical protein JWQ33_1098 [Ramlibacter sp.]|nr:hypothetical protein [Ramlibacter sp.]